MQLWVSIQTIKKNYTCQISKAYINLLLFLYKFHEKIKWREASVIVNNPCPIERDLNIKSYLIHLRTLDQTHLSHLWKWNKNSSYIIVLWWRRKDLYALGYYASARWQQLGDVQLFLYDCGYLCLQGVHPYFYFQVHLLPSYWYSSSSPIQYDILFLRLFPFNEYWNYWIIFCLEH